MSWTGTDILAVTPHFFEHRGQKAYNGVAILAKEGNADGIVVSDVLWDEDPAARFLQEKSRLTTSLSC